MFDQLFLCYSSKMNNLRSYYLLLDPGLFQCLLLFGPSTFWNSINHNHLLDQENYSNLDKIDLCMNKYGFLSTLFYLFEWNVSSFESPLVKGFGWILYTYYLLDKWSILICAITQFRVCYFYKYGIIQ